MTRKQVSTGTPWEAKVGYSRAVRVGPFAYVTGTVAADKEGNPLGGDDAYEQTKHALAKVLAALRELEVMPSDVVRTRMYVTDISRMDEYGRAHAEVFGTIRPCTSMVEVSALVPGGFLIEIEADAVVAEHFA